MKKLGRRRRYATASVAALIALLYTSINVFAVYNQVLVDYSSPLVYFGGSFGYTIIPSGINVSGCRSVTTPVGLSTEYLAFIESGGSYNFKYCDNQYHSYGSHQDYNGAYRDSVITSVPLYPDSLYLYRSYLGDASGHFYSDWCPSVCYNLEDVVLPGAAGMPYLVTGVESIFGDVHWGTLNVKYTYFTVSSDPNTGYYYCYKRVYNNNVGAYISPCDNSASYYIQY